MFRLFLLSLLTACTSKPAADSGAQVPFETTTWTITAITNESGGAGMHPWTTIRDCGGVSANCTTCFRLDNGHTLSVWTSTGVISSTDYNELGGLMRFEVGAGVLPVQDSGDSGDTDEPLPVVLDGALASGWILHLEAGRSDRMNVGFYDESSEIDLMDIEDGCPFVSAFTE